ncbi:MAG: elongation factor G [Peptococcaceae bacterium]|nr:elongation factor G [Peptococcaceae bacterium]
MKAYETSNIRNICLVGHGGTGKTSLAEAMLYNTGVTTRMGKVVDGNTVSDYLPEETHRQISMNLSLVPIELGQVKINLLDTPGYADFIGEVVSGLRVAETGLMVISGADGVEVQAEMIWEMMDVKKMPRMVYINKLDRENANVEKVLEQLKSSFPGVRFVQMQIPVGTEASFSQVIDILGKVPDTYADEAAVLLDALAEAAAEADDDVLMKYLEEEPLTLEDNKKILCLALAQNLMVPVLFGSVEKNVGVKELAQFISEYAVVPESQESKAVLVFKTLADAYLGKMSFLRVYGGTLNSDSILLNGSRDVDEKVGQLFFLRGKHQENTPAAKAGDIVVVSKLQETKTGDTLCGKEKKVTLDSIEFPKPTFSLAIRAKSKADEDKMGSALTRLSDEDPTLEISKPVETHQTLLTGIGDTQLDVIKEKLARKFGVGVETEAPRVPYRETIRKTVQIQGKHKKQTGGSGQYGDVWITLEPCPDQDFVFVETVVGGSVPRNFFPAVEKGLREAMSEGFLAGYPMTNIKCTLYDGSYHPVDSNEMAFKLAAKLAFRKGCEQANPVLKEPVVEVDIRVPEEFVGQVIGDLNNKRGHMLGMDRDGKMQLIRGRVPQAEMMRYTIDLRAMTQGRGSFTSTFVGYEDVPPKLGETLIAQLKAQKEG